METFAEWTRRNITPPDPVEPLMATKKKAERQATRNERAREAYGERQEQETLAALQRQLDAANNTRKFYVGKQKELQKTGEAGSKELLQNAQALRSAEAIRRERKSQIESIATQQRTREKNTMDVMRAERDLLNKEFKELTKTEAPGSKALLDKRAEIDAATKRLSDQGATLDKRIQNVAKAAGAETGKAYATIGGLVLSPTGQMEPVTEEGRAAYKRQSTAARTWSDKADELARVSAQAHADATYGLGKAGEIGVDLGINALQLAGDAAVGLAIPGGGLASMGVRAFGGGAYEAREAGASEGQQAFYGAAVAGVEILTERMFDGLAGIYGKGAADDIVEALVGRMAKTNAGRTVVRGVMGGLGEAAEEGVSSLVNPYLRSIYDNEEALREKFGSKEGYLASLNDAAYDSFIGLLLGGMGSVVSIASGKNAADNYALAVADALAADMAATPGRGAVVAETPFNGGRISVTQEGDAFTAYVMDSSGKTVSEKTGVQSKEKAIRAAANLGVNWAKENPPSMEKSPETRAEEAKAAEVTAEHPGATVATALAVEIQKAGNVKLADAVKMADIMTRIYDGGEVTGGEIDRLGLLKNPAVRAVFEAKVGMPVDVSTASNMRKSVKEIARQRKTLLAERAAQTAQVAEANEAAAHLEVLQEDNAPAAREAMEQAVAEHTQATEHAQAVAEHTQATEHAQAAPEAAQATEPTQTPEAGTQPGSAIRLADGTEITKQAFVEAMNPKSRAERIVAERAFDGLLATAEATQTKEGINGGNESGGGIEQRASGVAAGEPGESVSREAGTTETGATDQQRRAESIRAAVHAEVEEVGTDTILPDGTDTPTLRIVPEHLWTKEMLVVEGELNKLGLEVTYFTGFLAINGPDGAFLARAAVNGKLVYLCADHDAVSIEQLAQHEKYHVLVKRNPAMRKAVREKILRDHTEDELMRVAIAYVNEYGFFGASAEYILEEVEADAYAGIDILPQAPGDGAATKFTEQVREAVSEEAAAATDRTTGPPDTEIKYSIRTKAPPEQTGIAYKVFMAKDGGLYPPMVANPGGGSTPVGVWLDAEIGQQAAPSKTGRPQVQAGGKGTSTGKGRLAFRPGWHLGDIPIATQFARKNPETGAKDLFPENFVWAECEYAADVDYQDEAMSYGYTEGGKFRHSYAGLPKLPTDGYYRYRTNPNPDTVPWVITGAMKVTRILTDAETDAICLENGVKPMKRQGGPIDLERLGLKAGETEPTDAEPRFSREPQDAPANAPAKDSEGRELTAAQAEFFKDSKVRLDEDGEYWYGEGSLLPVYHATWSDAFTVFDHSKLGKNTDSNASDEDVMATAHVGFWFNTQDLTGRAGSRAEKVYLNVLRPYEAGTLHGLLSEILSHSDDGTPAEKGQAFAEWLQWNNYDGVVVEDEEFGGLSFVALSPEQIKRTDNLNPTSDPDIRFSREPQSSSYGIARDMIRQHGSEANVRETAEEVRVLATEIAEGKLTDKQAKARAEAIAGGVLGDIYILLNEGEIEAGKDLRSFLQANPIHVSEKARKDIHEYGKWARSNLPFMTTNKGGNSLDSVYQELTAMYGEGRFPSDITAASEQLERIAEVLREAAPSYGNLFREGSEALAEERAKLGDKILAEAKAIDVKKEGRDATIRERIQEARKGDPFQSAKFQDFIRQYDETYGEGASDRALRSAKELQRAFEREIRRTEDLAYRVNAEKTKAEAKRLISQAAQERKIKAEKRKLDAFRKKANATIREQDNTIAHAAKLIAAYDEAQKKTEQKHKREMTEQKAIAARNLEREKYRGQIKLNDALMSAKIKEGRKLEQQKRKTKEAKEEGKQKVAEARALSSKAAKEARRELSRRREETVRSMDNAEVDTLRKMPGNKTFKDRLAAAAKKIQTVGRDLYSTFVTETLELERLGHLQAANGAEGVTAYEAAKIAAACNSTISLALDRALYDHEGNVIGGALRDVVAVWDGKKIDMERQAYLQDYMLHLHNVDRMSIRAKARKKVEVFEAQNPWLKVIDSKEFALIAVGKDARSEIAREYVKLAKAERMAKDKPVFQDSENVPISAETSRKIAEQYEADMPWVKEKAQGIYDWWDVFMREWAVGRSISLEEYEALQEMYPHYVPTFRAGESETGANYIGRGSATVGKAIGRATGGTSEVRFIEDSYASLVGRTIRIARMNDLYMNIIETAMNDDAGAFDGFCVFDWENAPGDMAAYQNWLLDRDVFNNNDTPNVTLEKIGSEYRVNAWLEGERISAYISEELYQSLMAVSKTKSGTAIERDVDKAVKIGNFLTGPMKTMITGINPFFAVRNIARDLPTAVVNSISGLRFYKYWFQAWGKIRHSAEWNQFEALGGTHMGYYRNESGLKQGVAAKNWGKKKGLGKHIVSGLGWFNETSESVTRFAEYLATIDKLGDTYEGRIKGIHNAAEVTVDFSRKGSAGKVINAWVPYWNPAVQGVDKVIRSCFEAEAGKSRGAQFLRTTSRAAIVNMLPEAILYAVIKHLGKDDDWEKLSDYTKDNYFCIPLPDKHKFLKIPKNREWGAILGTPLMRILEGIDGRDNNFEHYAEDSLLVNFAPPFFPIIASQAFDLSRNKNFFGGTIIPNEYKDFSSGEFASKTLQWDEDTTIFAKGLSDAMFNALSPMQIDYIIHDYCGDFVSTFIDLFDMESWQAATGDAPEGYTVGGDVLESVKSLTDSFVADNRYSSFVTGEYYELMDELGRTVKDNQIKMGEDKAKESIEYKTRSAILSSFGKEISALNKQVRSMADGTEKDNAKFQITILAQKTLDFYEKCMSGKISEPTLYVKYDVYDWKVRDELMAMAKYNDGYTFEPTTFSPSAKLTDPNNKKKEYVFTPEQKSQYRYLFQENYERVVLRLLRSTEYERATGTARAELLEDAYYEARESAKKDLFAWLKEMGAPSTPKK